MKKHFLLVWMLVCTVSAWAGYGILLNGTTVFKADDKGEKDGYHEYMAHVPVKSGDYCQLINTTNDDKWAVNLNTYSKPGFTRDGDKIKISVTGCYDFYIQLKWEADQLYVGDGSNCGSGEPYPIVKPGGIQTVKLVPSEEWKVANAKFAAWIWGKDIAESHWTDFFEEVSEGNDTLQMEFNGKADSIDFVRFSPKTEKPSWKNKDKEVWGESKCRINYSSLVWTIKGWDDGTWNYVQPSTETFGLNIDGVYKPGKKNVLQTEWKEYMLRGVELKAGQAIQIENGETHDKWTAKFASTSYQFDVQDGKYVVAEDGKYDFYLKFIFENDEIYVSKEGTYTTAVRDRCTDVMMQAFFNNSYDDNAPGVGAPFNLGNTKWTTLTAQAEEIGHYFDLVWLPPSAQGEGDGPSMGYHPKDYSNQSSSWGTRAELEAVITALHNAGSKVIADIVINHCGGYTSWCDFPELNFGEFGTFHPDASYICRNDEVNAEWNKGSDKAGDCWGTASGSYDDGENWDGARDWSHDNVYVQDMFKGYLKWMKKEMKYDGFRYDKGDGFNNWHHDNYNKSANPYIAFMECYTGTDEIQSRIAGANYNLMALDFDTKWHVFNSIAGWDYSRGRGDGLLGRNWGRYAVEFIESHDWFLRDDNENEFGGRGNSLTEALKCRLLQANAFLLSMPGIPCVFYPHWKKYSEFIKPMIEARRLAGVHSESEVRDEYAEAGGYQATIVGKDDGYIILCLGNKAHQDFSSTGYTCKASYYNENDYGHDASYQIWVKPHNGATSVEQTPCAAPKVQKILRDGQLLILRDGQSYTITGQQIK